MNAEDYWVCYGLTAFQSWGYLDQDDAAGNGDPDELRAIEGEAFGPGTFAVYYESLREGSARKGVPIGTLAADAVSHEITHLFGAKDIITGPPTARVRVEPERDGDYTPETIRLIREHAKPAQ